VHGGYFGETVQEPDHTSELEILLLFRPTSIKLRVPAKSNRFAVYLDELPVPLGSTRARRNVGKLLVNQQLLANNTCIFNMNFFNCKK